MTILRPALTVLGLLLAGPQAQAAPKRELPPDLGPRHRAVKKRPAKRVVLSNRHPTTTGGYNGVTPGLPRMPRIHLPRNHKKRCYLTWTGFQLLPTGSRIFLQFNKRPKVIKTAKGASLTIKLPGCRVANWNNTRPLYTRYFPTPVRYARVRRRGKSTYMTVLLKKPVVARTLVTRLQGWYYLFISFRHTKLGWTYKYKRPKRRTHRRKRKPKRRRKPRR